MMQEDNMREKAKMILIPSGKFHLGTTNEQRAELAQRFGCHPTWLNDDLPAQDVEIGAFWLDRYPVTNAQYLAFAEATGHQKPGWWGDGFPIEYAKHPVVGVSGKDAEAYTEWVGKRLPTAAEWEAAIRHPEGKLFPWGDEWPPEKVAIYKEPRPFWQLPGTSPVGTERHGRSSGKIEDFAGQVSEWTSNIMPHHGVQFRMLRGASWFHQDAVSFRSAFGYYAYEGWTSAFTGFRCALDANLTPPSVPEKIPTSGPNREDVMANLLAEVRSLGDFTSFSSQFPVSDKNKFGYNGIQLQAAGGNSSHIRILVPYLGNEWLGLSAPESASWDGHGLLNWYDKRELEWEISTPTHASYMMSLKGLKLNAEFSVGDDFVDQVFTVTNQTGKSGRFSSSSCFSLQSHPLFYDCEGLRTYALTKDGKFKLIRQFQRSGECIRWITGSVGAELENLQRSMLAVTSRDGKWVVACARADKDGIFSVSCNTCFTCLHADSRYPVDKSRASRFRMYFLKGGLDDLLARFEEDLRQGVFD